MNGRPRHVTVRCLKGDGRFVVTIDGREWTVDAARVGAHTLSLLTQGVPCDAFGSENPPDPIFSHEVTLGANPASGGFSVRVGETPVAVSFNGRRRRRQGESGFDTGSGPQRLVAPMPGKIVRVLVKTGDPVAARQPLVVIEAMKMENELRAASAGRVAEIHVQDGQSVEAGALLAVIHR